MSERWKPSVTVAAVACRSRAGRVEYLIVEEATPAGMMLNNPAGHLEAGESPQQAVVREALEETGRAFVPTRLVGVYLARSRARAVSADTTYLRLAFAGEAGEPDPARRLDDGIVGTLWMTLDELQASRARHRSPLVLRSVQDHAAGRGTDAGLVVTDASVFARGESP